MARPWGPQQCTSAVPRSGVRSCTAQAAGAGARAAAPQRVQAAAAGVAATGGAAARPQLPHAAVAGTGYVVSPLNSGVLPAAPGEVPPLRLGSALQPLHPPLLLAPMAGITSAPFRLMCQDAGARVCVSEMILAHELVAGKARAHSSHSAAKQGGAGPAGRQDSSRARCRGAACSWHCRRRTARMPLTLALPHLPPAAQATRARGNWHASRRARPCARRSCTRCSPRPQRPQRACWPTKELTTSTSTLDALVSSAAPRPRPSLAAGPLPADGCCPLRRAPTSRASRAAAAAAAAQPGNALRGRASGNARFGGAPR
jgi:hypothetical protein